MMSTYSNMTNCPPITLESLLETHKKFKAIGDELRAKMNAMPVRAYASQSVIDELKQRFPAIICVSRIPGDQIRIASLPIIHEPALREGCYLIEYGDGHLEFHGPDET